MAKHEKISRTLRNEIASGTFGTTGKLPSEAQLVERFEVSRPTVARALRDLQTEGLIERRAGSGSFVRSDMQENTQARVLGLLVPDRGKTEIFEAICGELSALARVRDFGILWGGSPMPYADRDSTVEHARDVCSQFIGKRVTGVFFAPFEHREQKESVNRELVDTMHRAGIPVVLLDRDVTSFPKRSEFDLVSMNNFNAGFMLAEHLIRLGCKNLRFVTRPSAAPTVDARIAGAREAILRYGETPHVRFRVEGDPTCQSIVKDLKIGRECDGILTANDYTAAELLRTFAVAKIQVPDQVRLGGFDDVRYATLLTVALTTVHQPCRELAEVAFRAMIERIREPQIPPRMISLAPRLVVRESCGAYRT